MAIYVEWEGMKGNVTADGFADHMDVISFNFGISRAISMEPGNMSNRENNRPSLSEITLVKTADNTLNALFKESVTGSAGKKITIRFVQTGGDKVNEFMNYELENALVSGYSVSADSHGEPMETINISYSKILASYCDTGADNSFGSNMVCGYDLATAKPL